MSKPDRGGLDPEALSRPERSVLAKQGRAVLRRILDCGGCYCCTRRDPKSEGWGRARCGKVKPAEFMGEGCTFEPDQEQIYNREKTE